MFSEKILQISQSLWSRDYPALQQRRE